MKPLIVFALWNLGRAGAERVVLELAKGAQADGYRVKVLTACGGGAMESDFRQAQIEVVIGPETTDRLKTIQFFTQELTRERPDILHTHLGADVWAGFVARKKNIHPWIITSHNDDRDEPFLRHLLRGFAYRRADQVVSISEHVKAYTKKEFRVADVKSSVIYNGIDLSVIHARPATGFQDVPRLLHVGRLTAQKGQDILLRALAEVKRPWTLDLCGEGEDRLRLERLCESLGIAPRVHFLGSVQDVPQRLAQADVFCFPSQWEGQSLAILEAAASGLPILANDLPVFREMFSEQAVMYAQDNTVEAWTKALRLLLADPFNALKRSREAQAMVKKRFTKEVMIESYLELYRKRLKEFSSKKN